LLPRRRHHTLAHSAMLVTNIAGCASGELGTHVAHADGANDPRRTAPLLLRRSRSVPASDAGLLGAAHLVVRAVVRIVPTEPAPRRIGGLLAVYVVVLGILIVHGITRPTRHLHRRHLRRRSAP